MEYIIESYYIKNYFCKYLIIFIFFYIIIKINHIDQQIKNITKEIFKFFLKF